MKPRLTGMKQIEIISSYKESFFIVPVNHIFACISNTVC